MTRAELAAEKAYPPLVVKTLYGEFDCNAYARLLFWRGYQRAEKDTIERAIAWLKENVDKYIVDLTPTYPDAPSNIIVGGICWEHLKQAIEEEQI